MTPVEIPLQPIDQEFRVPLGGLSYVLRLTWNQYASAWILDIASDTTAPLVSGIPLITGVNLLDPFPYLGIAGGLYVQSDADPQRVPGVLDLGVSGHLYFVPTDG